MTDSPEPTLVSQRLCSDLPLAVYREVAAHLHQVVGVEVELLPQDAQTFDYQQSQVGGIAIQYTAAATKAAGQRVQQILAYYGNRYGNWQLMD